jgi:Spy/CpxP family protein refolding chaperone
MMTFPQGQHGRAAAYLPPLERILSAAVIVVFATLWLALAVSATDEDRIAAFLERAEQTKERLALTPEQEAQITPIMEDARDKRLTILEKYGFGNGTKPSLSLRKKVALAKEMRAVRDETNDRLARHLTREQMQEYEEIQEENRARMKEMMKSR